MEFLEDPGFALVCRVLEISMPKKLFERLSSNPREDSTILLIYPYVPLSESVYTLC
jgi:hypothetical protein